MSRGVQHKLISRLECRALDYCGQLKKYADHTCQRRDKLTLLSHRTHRYGLKRGVTLMILGLNKESKNPGSAFNAHSVVPIQLGPTDPQVPLATVEHKQHRCRYDDRVWPVAPTLGIGTTVPTSALEAAADLGVSSTPGITINNQYTTGSNWFIGATDATDAWGASALVFSESQGAPQMIVTYESTN